MKIDKKVTKNKKGQSYLVQTIRTAQTDGKSRVTPDPPW